MICAEACGAATWLCMITKRGDVAAVWQASLNVTR
jgi:hypothetical protein